MTDNRLRIAFMGTPDFALAALKALYNTPHNLICVYSQPPRPKGRGQQTQLSPVHAFAEGQGIPVYTPINFKDPADREIFKSHTLDLAIVAAYGLILPQDILDAPKYGCINIHGSLLPRWRGASPIQHAIWHGDAQTGIGIMQMERGLDTGPVIAEQSVPITPNTTASSLHDDLAALGARMIVDCVNVIAANGSPAATSQKDALSTYAPMLKKSDGIINWNQSAAEIDRQIRALNPWPGVYTTCSGKRIKILAAVPQNEITDKSAGTPLNKQGDIACGGGTILRLSQLQPEGKNPMDFASALNGHYITIGNRFS
jgi:methionyl-tRNA formyltransferase